MWFERVVCVCVVSQSESEYTGYLRGSYDLKGASTRKCRNGGHDIPGENSILWSECSAIWLTRYRVVHSSCGHLSSRAASIVFVALYQGFAMSLYHCDRYQDVALVELYVLQVV